MKKIKCFSELPLCLNTTKQKELSFQEIFEFSLREYELLLNENKRGDYTEHKIIVDEDI